MSDALSPSAADGPWGRLALFALVSAFVHFLLIAGFPLDSIGGDPGEPTVITARLETGPVAEEASAAPVPADPAPEADKTEIPAPAPTPAPVRAEAATARAPEKTSPLAGPDLPLIRDHYYPVGQLDVHPTPRTPVQLNCAEAGTLKGEIKLMILINEQGFVDDASQVDGPEAGTCVDQLIRQVKPVRFSPGIKDGREVKSRAIIVMRAAQTER
ncbi:MAG: hypothetical protein ACREUW_21375 [Burkholderiales bacterium]